MGERQMGSALPSSSWRGGGSSPAADRLRHEPGDGKRAAAVVVGAAVAVTRRHGAALPRVAVVVVGTAVAVRPRTRRHDEPSRLASRRGKQTVAFEWPVAKKRSPNRICGDVSRDYQPGQGA